ARDTRVPHQPAEELHHVGYEQHDVGEEGLELQAAPAFGRDHLVGADRIVHRVSSMAAIAAPMAPASGPKTLGTIFASGRCPPPSVTERRRRTRSSRRTPAPDTAPPRTDPSRCDTPA